MRWTLISAILGILASGAADAQRAPNVVLVLLDDIGVGKVSAYGGSVQTPVFDALASTGVMFTSAYSHPVCSPTRAAALTGRHGQLTGIGNGVPWVQATEDTWDLQASELTLAEIAQHEGIQAFASGKWHLVGSFWDASSGAWRPTTEDGLLPALHPILVGGFQRYSGNLTNILLSEGWTYTDWPYTRASGSRTMAIGSTTMSKTWATTSQTDDALRYIEGAEHGRPWLLWLSYSAPHKPWEPAPASEPSPAADRTSPAAYAEFVRDVDLELGRLVAGLPPHTLLLIMGDNGTPGSVAEQVPAKGSVMQAGILVPLIAWGDMIDQPGRVSDRLVHVVDLFATALEVLGLPDAPSGVHSWSFADELSFAWEASVPRETVYIRRHSPNGLGPWDWVKQAAIRDDGYKLERDSTTPAGDVLWIVDGLTEAKIKAPWSDEEKAVRAEMGAFLDAMEAEAP